MAEGISDFTAIVERAGVHQPALDAQNGEELMHVQPGVSIALGNRPPESPGSLLTSTKQVVWLSDTDRARGYSMGFYVYITACCFQGPRGLHLSLYIRSD
ncbi:hypothetical protein M0R45_037895 [Rubus argutus]|uniref:Uncharacterized protein n=1 Tax=Rubus argutus TaxID=59490 RepID=A0AAW1W3D2_RUBAR